MTPVRAIAPALLCLFGWAAIGVPAADAAPRVRARAWMLPR